MEDMVSARMANAQMVSGRGSRVGRVLITGNLGYVGPAVTARLRAALPRATLIGFDAGFFSDCLTAPRCQMEALPDIQYFGDVRAFPNSLLRGVDAVVHLAAVSNDPMGERFADVTDAVNHRATAELAAAARAAGGGAVGLASRGRLYGAAEDGARHEGDAAQPLTAYARSKVAAERALARMPRDDMRVTCLRFATACGMSPRLRLDLVLNDFVAGALAWGEVGMLGDGSAWRPLIDVSDMALAVEWAITADGLPDFLVVNVGWQECQHRIAALAEAVAEAIPGVRVATNPAAVADARSYQVDFSLYRRLAPKHQPRSGLARSIAGLRDGLAAIGFADRDFRRSRLIRLQRLDALVRDGALSDSLLVPA